MQLDADSDLHSSKVFMKTDCGKREQHLIVLAMVEK